MTEGERRREQMRMLRNGGMPARSAGIATYPELPPDSADQHAQVDIDPTKSAGVVVSPGQISAGIAKVKMVRQLVAGGVDATSANSYATSVFEQAPETLSVVDYERMASVIGKSLAGMKPDLTEKAITTNQFARDAEFMMTSLGAIFGGSQQAAFGIASGERLQSAMERMFPDADIRDDDGTVHRKSVFWQSIKGVTAGATGVLLGAVSPVIWPAGPAGEALKAESRSIAKGLLESDYRDSLLTGQEVMEYWMHGDGLLGSKLPEPGTPERAAYDQQVRDYVSQGFASQDNKVLNALGMGSLAISGAIFDVFADPALLISEAPKLVGKGMRGLAPISSTARVTAAVAERTRRLSDTLDAVKDARAWVDTTAEKLSTTPSKAMKDQHAHAKKTLLRLQGQLNTMSGNASGEAFLLPTTPRVRPEHIKPLADVYLNPLYETNKARFTETSRFIKERIGEASSKVKDIEKQLKVEGVTPEAKTAAETELRQAIVARDKWKDTRTWFKSKGKNPQLRVGSFLADEASKQVPYEPNALLHLAEDGADQSPNVVLRQIDDNIRRGLEQGAPEEEIVQWERTYQDVLDAKGTATPIIERSKLTGPQILAERLHAQRLRANATDRTPLIDLDGMDAVQGQQRLAYGPDQSETAAEAAKVLAAGGDIDDVAFYSMGLDLYNTSYGARFRAASGTQPRGFGKMKKVMEDGKMVEKPVLNTSLGEDEWLGKDAWRTKIEAAEWQQTRAEKLGDYYTRGLYPGTWNLRPAGVLMHAREPMRVLQSMSPRLYTRVHDAMNAQHVELTRMTEFFSRELENLGVYKKVGGSYVHDPERGKAIFDIMEMKPETDEYLDAINTLSEGDRMSVRRIRQEMDFMMDKLGVRNTDRHITGYVSHVFDRRWHDNGARPLENRGFGATAEVFDPYLVERTGARGYVPDIALALDQYSRAAARKLHMEPMFVDLEAAAAAHVKQHPGDEWFGTYINFMVNNFKGVPSTGGQWVDMMGGLVNARMRAMDNVVKAATKAGGVTEKVGTAMHGVGQVMSNVPGKIGKFGGALAAEGVRVNEFGSQMKYNGMPLYAPGDVSRTAMMVTALVYSSVLGGSGRYFPMAVATGLATTGSRMGLFNTAKGILAMGTEEGRALAKTAGIDKQWQNILEDAAWTKLGHMSASMPSFNGVTVVGPSITATENLIRGWTFHASLSDLMRKSNYHSWDEVVEAGLQNAFMHEAVRTTEEVNHIFGILGKPPVAGRMSKSGSAHMTQFLSFIPKQTEELMAQAMQDLGKIGQYMMISGYIQRVGAKIGLDMSDYVGIGYAPKSPEETTSISFELMNSLLTVTGEQAKMFGSEGGDPLALKRAKEQLSRNAQMFIPFAAATHRLKQSAEALELGALYTDKGSKIYDYDLGGFQWDGTKSVASNMSRLPSGLLSESGNPEIPTDLPSILTGINSTQRKMERQAYRASKDASARQMYRRSEIADAVQEAVNKGDGAEFSKQLQKAISEGMLPPDITSMVERSYLEHALPRLLREQVKGDQSMLNMIDILQRERAMYENEFNYSGDTP